MRLPLIATGLILGMLCPQGHGQATPPPKDLAARQWVLQKLEGQAVDSTVRSTLTIAPDGKAGGAAGCNRWFGNAVFAGSSLRFSQVGMTRMACAKPAMEREASFTRMLGQVRGWKLAAGVLSLLGEDGVELAELRAETGAGSRK
jgi:putative lipoprotein